MQKSGPAVQDWGDARGTPAFGKKMAAWFLPEHRAGWFRESWSVGHVISTPDDQSSPDLIPDDVPYAAILGFQNAWMAYGDRDLHAFGWVFGIVGPAAQGESIQKGFHKMIGSQEPMGWSNQIPNEPALNFYYTRKHKVARARWADVAVGAGANLGNIFTGARGTLETRLGWHLPGGFVRLPDPIFMGLSLEAVTPDASPRTAVYASVALRATALVYTVLLDGSLLHDSPSVDHETFITALLVGLHLERPRWGVHFTWAFSTDSVDPSVVISEPDTTVDYGTVTLDFRY